MSRGAYQPSQHNRLPFHNRSNTPRQGWNWFDGKGGKQEPAPPIQPATASAAPPQNTGFPSALPGSPTTDPAHQYYGIDTSATTDSNVQAGDDTPQEVPNVIVGDSNAKVDSPPVVAPAVAPAPDATSRPASPATTSARPTTSASPIIAITSSAVHVSPPAENVGASSHAAEPAPASDNSPAQELPATGTFVDSDTGGVDSGDGTPEGAVQPSTGAFAVVEVGGASTANWSPSSISGDTTLHVNTLSSTSSVVFTSHGTTQSAVAPTPSSANANNASDSTALPLAALIGIIVGSIACLAFLLLGVFLFWRRRRRNKADTEAAAEAQEKKSEAQDGQTTESKVTGDAANTVPPTTTGLTVNWAPTPTTGAPASGAATAGVAVAGAAVGAAAVVAGAGAAAGAAASAAAARTPTRASKRFSISAWKNRRWSVQTAVTPDGPNHAGIGSGQATLKSAPNHPFAQHYGTEIDLGTGHITHKDEVSHNPNSAPASVASAPASIAAMESARKKSPFARGPDRPNSGYDNFLRWDAQATDRVHGKQWVQTPAPAPVPVPTPAPAAAEEQSDHASFRTGVQSIETHSQYSSSSHLVQPFNAYEPRASVQTVQTTTTSVADSAVPGDDSRSSARLSKHIGLAI